MRFSVTPVPYAQVPSLGPDHILARLGEGDLADFPLPDPRLGDVPGDEAVVIAGQQPGLLTGPLYTVLKAATSVALARELSASAGRPVRALFWVASEDHDVLEVNRVRINGQQLVCPYEQPLRRGEVPQVGDISLENHRAAIGAFASDALPATEFKEEFLEWIAGSRYDSYATLFSDLLEKIFQAEEFRTVDPRALRPTTAPVLARLVARWPEAVAAFEEGMARVRRLGFSPPLTSLGFFEIVDGKRVPVRIDGDGVALSSGACSFGEAAARIRSAPASFSPGAALRPVLQDAALPVAATVCGPTEILYVWQIRELYAVAEVRPSAIFPRLSATFVEGKIERKAAQAGLPVSELFSVAARISAVQESAAAPAADAVEEAGRSLLSTVTGAVNPANERWLDRTRRSLEGLIKKTADRLRKEALEADDVSLARLRTIGDAVLPRGKPQDRAVNVFDFLARYGAAWTRALCRDLDPWEFRHQIVTFK